MALALAAGAALPPAGVDPLPAALLLLAAVVRPMGSGARPTGAGGAGGAARTVGGWRLGVRWLPLVALGGLVHGTLAARTALDDCRWGREAAPLEVSGWVREVEAPGRVVLEVVDGPCPGAVRVQGAAVGGPRDGVGEGTGLRVQGRWVTRAEAAPGLDPLRAGVILARHVEVDGGRVPGLAPALARVRRAGVARVERLFAREGDLVAALVFARRDGLARDLRDAFAATGTAHLLAISGFHVGVLAGLILWLAGRVLPPRRAVAAGAVAAWGYVAVLGFPDAATRAALLLTLVGAGRWLGRPVSAAGALGTALLTLVLVDPGVAGRIGAQLSFAGALGLAVWARPWTARAVAGWTARGSDAPGGRARTILEAVVVTVAATVATLPFVAWHFERVSTVALPASLGATPLVALALPSVLVALVLDALGLPGAGVAATGAEGLLGLTRVWVEAWAGVPGASWPLARPDVVAAAGGAAVGGWLARRRPGVGFGVRGVVVAAGVVAGVAAWPVSGHLLRNGSLEVHMFDVGQGDAFGLRTPRGRWVVVDAGPPSGARLAADLRRAGVRTIDLLVLSHPDADHVGGAAVLLEAFPVGAVVGPGTVRGAGPWRDAVVRAVADGTPWRLASRGDSLSIDGVALRVLHPPQGDGVARDPNEASLVMEVAWRGVSILFTGDAPVSAERAVLDRLGGVDVLKVGHHGSATSTDPALLDHIRPRVALVSVGRGNRYGHPDPGVLARLRERGVEIWRTDERGAVRLRVDPAGRWSVGSGR